MRENPLISHFYSYVSYIYFYFAENYKYMNNITINLNLPTYLSKYLKKQFGDSYKVSQKDWLGILLVAHLKKKNASGYHYKKEVQKETSYPVMVSTNSAYRNGFHLLKENNQQIVNAIDGVFRTSLYHTAIINYENYSIDYKTSIMNVLEMYGITEEDLQYDTIRKDFNRKRKDIENYLFRNI